MSPPPLDPIACPVCGRSHRPARLRAGQRALCVECGATLPRRRPQRDRALAYAVTAVILAVPAVQFPLVEVRKFGAERASYLWSGVEALWENGMPLLAVWVALCGIAVPLALITTIVVTASSAYPGTGPLPFEGAWVRLTHVLQHWAMPEVHVLAVLVAFIKIGVLVSVEPGAGLWFYGAMTLALLLAWRNTDVAET